VGAVVTVEQRFEKMLVATGMGRVCPAQRAVLQTVFFAAFREAMESIFVITKDGAVKDEDCRYVHGLYQECLRFAERAAAPWN
jgi:hypothetical protein